MSGKSWIAFALIVVTFAASAGCNLPPRVVIENLPIDTIPEATSANRTQSRPAERHIPQPNQSAQGKATNWVPQAFPRPWKWIVIHHSATDRGSAAIFDRYHRGKGWDELGYHFVIGNGRGAVDGKVEVGSRWVKQKWGAHCKTPGNAYNTYGIGICIVGKYSDKLPSPAQLDSLRRLVRFLSDRYGIAPANIIGHRDAPGTSTKCPGDTLHRYIHGTLRPEIAQHRSARR